jgi:hypothetical protein
VHKSQIEEPKCQDVQYADDTWDSLTYERAKNKEHNGYGVKPAWVARYIPRARINMKSHKRGYVCRLKGRRNVFLWLSIALKLIFSIQHNNNN